MILLSIFWDSTVDNVTRYFINLRNPNGPSFVGAPLFKLLIHDIVLYAKRISWFGYGWILFGV